MRNPSIVSVGAVVASAEVNRAEVRGRWVPARPMGYSGLRNRFRAALLVFAGRADALTYPGQ